MNDEGSIVSARRRLIVLAPTPPPFFGHSILTIRVVASLRRLGLLAAHVDIRDDRSLENLNRLDAENLRIGVVGAWRLLGAMRRHPDAGVYLQISQGRWGFLRDALWVWIARAGGRPVYVHLLGGRFQHFHAESGPLMRRLIRTTIAQAHRLWVLTPSLRICFEGLADPERVLVLENVVSDPMEELGGEAGRPAGDGEGLRILFLSNLREGKGHDDLLAALTALGDRAAGWRVRLVGTCDELTRAEVERWIGSRLAPGVRVELVGPRSGVAKAEELARADVFAFPSRYDNEGQPLVVLEAMAAGLPIVSTRHRGIPDSVGEEREALLVDPGDVEAMAAALLRLAEDATLRERLGAAARLRWEEQYAPQHYDRGLLELLAEE